MPWMPIFLAACFFLHPVLGLTAAAGGLMLVTMAFLTHRRTGRSAKDLAQFAGLRAAGVEADRRNSETVIAMGMGATLAGRWRALNERYLEAVERAGEVAGTFGSISKALRLLLQSAMLGMGAFLVIEGEMSAGAMMAASVMMGRALAPIETTIANWKGFTQARQSMRRLSDILSRLPADRSPTELPAPCRSLSVEHVTVGAPGSSTALVNDVSFSLAAGEALGIIGPSGIGKTSLVRAMVGIWPVARGSVRLDGARLDQWDPTVLGRHIGFVSQNVDLFDGTIAENIARMAESPDSQAVVAAAQAAGAHDMILRMAKGYDTPIGDGGAVLSGGQRQRIALARALYGDPFVLVLDEAGSNLDNEGENALMAAIRAVKARKGIVVTVAHRPSALSACDKVLLLGAGGQPVFGPRDEILKKIGLAPAAPANLKVVQAVPAGADR
jgi:ATP-binding cassette subfamily C protein